MSNAFTNFLGGVVNGIFGSSADMKDYQHANRLYVANTYARAPKMGFLYFVEFNINRAAVSDKQWITNSSIRDVGLLVKKIDLPKFSIATETVNQYNRKTVIQTGIKYNTVSVDFHDDNSNITTNLWKNYYNYYYADSKYGDTGASSSEHSQVPLAYTDTKYGLENYAYGLNNKQNKPFFETIDIYVMHQHKFTRISLINPIVTEWSHDGVDQSDGAKLLGSKMSIAYEDVIYKTGTIEPRHAASNFTAVYYDKAPSPLSVNGNGDKTLFGAGGAIAGASAVLGSIEKGNYLGAAIQAVSAVKSAKQITAAGLKSEGYSVLSGVLGNIQTTGNQPGAIGSTVATAVNQGSGNGIKLFSGSNSSISPTTVATSVNINNIKDGRK